MCRSPKRCKGVPENFRFKRNRSTTTSVVLHPCYSNHSPILQFRENLFCPGCRRVRLRSLPHVQTGVIGLVQVAVMQDRNNCFPVTTTRAYRLRLLFAAMYTFALSSTHISTGD